MEQTKEEILSNCLKLINVNDKILKEEWGMELKAMGEYAQQVAIAFAEWVQQSFDGFSYSADTKNWEVYGETRNDTKQYTTEQLFDLFIKQYQK